MAIDFGKTSANNKPKVQTNYLHWLDINWIKENSSIGDNQGLPFTDRFVCLLNAPKGEHAQNGWLELQVLSVELPNFSIDPVEQELNGAKRFYFKGRTDSDLSITFLESSDLLLRRFFYYWLEKAVSVNETEGVKRDYMEKYMPIPSEFVIFPLNYRGEAQWADRFINVFPYDISGISYNYAQSGEVLKTIVKFKYMFHYMTEIKDSNPYHISETTNYSKMLSDYERPTSTD